MLTPNLNDFSSMDLKRLQLQSSVCVVLLLTCAGSGGATPANWPQFRGPEASGVSAEAVPARWYTEQALSWHVPAVTRLLPQSKA